MTPRITTHHLSPYWYHLYNFLLPQNPHTPSSRAAAKRGVATVGILDRFCTHTTKDKWLEGCWIC